jgi:serine protease inhibitor
MRLARFAPAILLLATLGGALPDATLSPIPLLVSGDVTRQVPAGDAPVPTMAASITRLGDRLLAALPPGNQVVSPLSVAYAYAMLRAGAGGSTAADLDRTFGFPAHVDSAFNSITAQIATTSVPGKRTPTVCISNGVFLQHGLPVGPAFLDTLAAQYGTGVHPVDFSTGDARRVMDEWVRRQTADKIKDIGVPTDPSTVLVLANTVYLHADWADPFKPEATTDEPFHAPDGTVAVPTMQQIAELPYASGDGWQAVELPYRNSDLVMRIFLPDAGRDPAPPATMAFQPRRIELLLPKWTFKTSMDLRPLGPPSIFERSDGLNGIFPGAYVSAAQHQAYVAVDEKGTEAAAATSLAIAMSGQVAPATVVRADHPFTFAVVHRPTNIPLFTGRVVRP